MAQCSVPGKIERIADSYVFCILKFDVHIIGSKETHTTLDRDAFVLAKANGSCEEDCWQYE